MAPLHWPSLLLTFGLRAAAVSPLVPHESCSPAPLHLLKADDVACKPSRADCLTSHSAWIRKPRGFSQLSARSAIPSQAPQKREYKIRVIFFFPTDFSLHWTCSRNLSLMECGFSFLHNKFQTGLHYPMQIALICKSSLLSIWGTLSQRWCCTSLLGNDIFCISVQKACLKSQLAIAKPILKIFAHNQETSPKMQN